MYIQLINILFTRYVIFQHDFNMIFQHDNDCRHYLMTSFTALFILETEVTS